MHRQWLRHPVCVGGAPRVCANCWSTPRRLWDCRVWQIKHHSPSSHLYSISHYGITPAYHTMASLQHITLWHHSSISHYGITPAYHAMASLQHITLLHHSSISHYGITPAYHTIASLQHITLWHRYSTTQHPWRPPSPCQTGFPPGPCPPAPPAPQQVSPLGPVTMVFVKVEGGSEWARRQQAHIRRIDPSLSQVVCCVCVCMWLGAGN